MTDTRIFRYTNHRDELKYFNRRTLSAVLGYVKGSSRGYGSYKNGRPVKIEVTNAEATDGWTDVTEEFLGSGTQSRP